jgi:hypothetical protein
LITELFSHETAPFATGKESISAENLPDHMDNKAHSKHAVKKLLAIPDKIICKMKL